MKNIRIIIFLSLIFLTGCSPYIPVIKYEPTASLEIKKSVVRTIKVGSFSDNRGTDLRWLGAVRNGFGMPIKKLFTDKLTSNVVSLAFKKALDVRNLSTGVPQMEIQGVIIKFDCSTMVNYEAHAHLRINVISLPSQEVLFSKTYRTDSTENGFGGGFYGGYKDLAILAQRTLNETIDKFFLDPQFTALLTSVQSN
ncbi:MAG TPA: hypothetical protein EYG49_06365 [Gammaproteobacteria bacterium]|nr:hypothetical protein [Gammaproteobacteria bacterium]